MSRTKKRRLRYNAAISALVVFVVLVSGATIGMMISQAVKINMALTDDVIATVYLLALTLIYLLVSYLRPRTRR